MNTLEGKSRSTLSLGKVLLASVVLPPAGVVLLWLRPLTGTRWARTGELTFRLVLSCALVILTVAYAVRLGIVHVEMSGAGWRPIFSLRDPGSDQDALERHRAEQKAVPVESALVSAPVSENAQPNVQVPAAAELARIEGNESTATAAKPVTGTAWADFRGRNRDGNYTDGPIQTAWPSEGLKPLWKQPVGGGYASFVIANGKAYTIEQRRNQEVVAAYDMDSGRELWTHGWSALFSESMGGDGPRATPVWDEGQIFALGATGELHVLDAESGKLVWSKNILTDNGAQNITWGMANSPLIVGDKVIVTPGGPGEKSVVAYHKKTGQRLWGALSDRAAYTSPVMVTLAGQPQLVVVTATRITGLTAEEGKLLWEFPWATMYEINSAQPIVTGANQLFVSAGYDHGAVLLEISKTESDFASRALWENKNMKNRFNSSVLHQGHIYGFDEGIFACIDVATGQRKWKGGRYGYGQALLAGQHIIVLSESGELVLLRATPESHQEVARFAAIEGKTWNHPAIADGILLVRNEREMAAFRIGS